MHLLRFFFAVAAIFLLPSLPCLGQDLSENAPPGFHAWTLAVDGVERSAIVYALPKDGEGPKPVVFVFHGHGGTARNAARSFQMHRHWPEAIVVYPQGLNTPGRLTDPEGKKPGWQHGEGAQADRDLHFFDALLAKLKQDWKVDDTRIYSTGHSNGGGFTYLLWATRGEHFAAMAPSGSAAAGTSAKLKAKPAMHIAGEKDPLVKYAWQERTMELLKTLNGCEPKGTVLAPYLTSYPSPQNTPFLAYIHPGGHEFPSDCVPAMVRFFQEHHLVRPKG